MSLSANVEALLDVYSKCLGLLHVFGDKSKDKSKTKSKSKSKSLDALSRSLSSDRAKVVDVFSSRLSESGSRLAKGDTRSRSALRRIVDRLTKVLSGIFSIGTSKDTHGQLNYDALRALSRSSRVGAIHAIDDLSVRLKRGSAGSTTSSKTARSGSRLIKPSSRALPAPQIPSPKTKAKEQQLAVVPSAKTSSHAGKSSKDGKSKSKAAKSAGSKASSTSSRSKRKSSKSKEREENKAASKTETTASPAADTFRYTQAATQTQSRRAVDRVSTASNISTTSTARAGPLRTEMHTSDKSTKHSARPISMLTSSSASTRLGEIPEHKLRRRIAPELREGAGAQESFEYYNISVAYPMRPLWIPEEETKGKKKDKREKEKEETDSEKKKHFWSRGRA